MYQVAELAAALRQYNIEKVVTSPFLRCLQTTSALCKDLPLLEVEVDNILCEVRKVSLSWPL
jgi:broad specificity phosphatase PhoE